MVPFEEALELLSNKSLASVYKGEIELVPLWEAGGMVLAEDITAGEDIPPFDRSPVDGYALTAADTAGAGDNNHVELEITGSITAGSPTLYGLTRGKAMKIFTGAPLPEHADCIVKAEDVSAVFSAGEKQYIKLNRPVARGEVIAFKGEDIRSGQTMLLKGTAINPAHMGILATLGVNPVPVYKKPLIGIFSTGNELVDADCPLKHGQLRASNIYTLAEIIRIAGCTPVNLGVVKDSVGDIIGVYHSALKMGLPLVISTGGTASGDNDLIKEAMSRFGSYRLFDKVAIRPGAPVVASVREQQMLIGLSGNPAGATVGALTLILPVVSGLAGRIKELERARATLQTPIMRRGGLRAFLWGNFFLDKGGLLVELYNNQFCGAVKSYASSNCLIDVPAGRVDYPAGESVTILKFSV